MFVFVARIRTGKCGARISVLVSQVLCDEHIERSDAAFFSTFEPKFCSVTTQFVLIILAISAQHDVWLF